MDGKWYLFNDSSVSVVPDRKTLESNSFGEKGAVTNAYMLMYRLMSKEDNRLPVADDKIPDVVRARMAVEIEKAKADRDPLFANLHVTTRYPGP